MDRDEEEARIIAERFPTWQIRAALSILENQKEVDARCPKTFTPPGREVRIITANKLHYGGPIISCSAEWLVMRDRVKNREIRLNLHLVESVEVIV